MRKHWLVALITIAVLSGVGSRPAPPPPALQSRPGEALAAIRERLCAFDYDAGIDQALLDLGPEPSL